MSANTRPGDTFPFLKLPGELRNRIYVLVFTVKDRLDKATGLIRKANDGLSVFSSRSTRSMLPNRLGVETAMIPNCLGVETAILRTCKQVYREALDHLYQREFLIEFILPSRNDYTGTVNPRPNLRWKVHLITKLLLRLDLLAPMFFQDCLGTLPLSGYPALAQMTSLRYLRICILHRYGRCDTVTREGFPIFLLEQGKPTSVLYSIMRNLIAAIPNSVQTIEFVTLEETMKHWYWRKKDLYQEQVPLDVLEMLMEKLEALRGSDADFYQETNYPMDEDFEI